MIKGLTGGPGVTVNGGSMSFPYVPQNANNPIQGMLRINGQDIQTFDGSGWVTVGASYANISFDTESLDLLQWARTQRTIALNRLTLAQNNPALMKALEAVKRAEDNFEFLSKFVEDDLAAELREIAP
jgi:hypothetical protein